MWNPYRNVVDSWKSQNTVYGRMAVVLFFLYVWLFIVLSAIIMINPIGQGWECLLPAVVTSEEGMDVYVAWLIQLIYAYIFCLALLAETVGPRVSTLSVLILSTGIAAMINVHTKNSLGSMNQEMEECWTAVFETDITGIVWPVLTLVLLLIDVFNGDGRRRRFQWATSEETHALV
jgi:hypothetical protein